MVTQVDTKDVARSGYGISTDQCWILWGESKLLWLPKEYRPYGYSWSYASAVIGATVVMQSMSGRIVIMSFSPENHGGSGGTTPGSTLVASPTDWVSVKSHFRGSIERKMYYYK